MKNEHFFNDSTTISIVADITGDCNVCGVVTSGTKLNLTFSNVEKLNEFIRSFYSTQFGMILKLYVAGQHIKHDK